MYVSDEGSMSTLIHRRLTTYKRDNSGKYTVVGDLATDSGKSSDGGKTWTYTLKDGHQVARTAPPITSKDIRHTFERQFAPFIIRRPDLHPAVAGRQSGTDYRKAAAGRSVQGQAPAGQDPGDAGRQDHRLPLQERRSPTCRTRWRMAGYAAVPEKDDTKEKYDKKPVASGPYKIESFKAGKCMKLVRNTELGPEDGRGAPPVPGRATTSSSVSSFEASTKRLVADRAENQNAISYTNQVDASSMQSVRTDPEVKKRSLSGYQPYVGKISFNMDRLKDKKVREAIAYALPAQSLQQAFGGSGGGELGGSYLSPTVAGHTGARPLRQGQEPAGRHEEGKGSS